MVAHSQMASFLAEKMQEEGLPVIYPGLKSHKQLELFQSLSNVEYGAGGILTLECSSSDEARILATDLQAEKFGALCCLSWL